MSKMLSRKLILVNFMVPLVSDLLLHSYHGKLSNSSLGSTLESAAIPINSQILNIGTVIIL